MLYTGLFVQTVISGQMGLFAGSTQATLNEMYIIIGGMTALAYYQHRANIVRLLHHTERKTYLTKSNKV